MPAAEGPKRAVCWLQEPASLGKQDRAQDPDHVGLHATGKLIEPLSIIAAKFEVRSLQ